MNCPHKHSVNMFEAFHSVLEVCANICVDKNLCRHFRQLVKLFELTVAGVRLTSSHLYNRLQ